MTQGFPLAWPPGWPRTPRADQKRGDAAFKRHVDSGRGWRDSKPWTFAQARDALLEEVWRHTASGVVISSNFPLAKGVPTEKGRRPDDEGIAVYFQRGGKPYVMVCDRYIDAEGNMRSLALALEAMRALERHGGGIMLERAYEGFAALPAPKQWWEVLGLALTAGRAEIAAAYRVRAAAAHPDRGGSEAAMAEINAARDAALRHLEP